MSTVALATAISAATIGRRTTPAAARSRPAAALSRPAQRSSSTRRLAAQQRSAVCVRAVLDVAEDNFEQEVLKSELPVLIDFWAHWCGPCKLMAPLMDWAEKEYAGKLKVVKIETDPNPNLIEQYKVYGLPCFILFKEGAPVQGSQHEGAMPKKQLVEYLARHGIQSVAQV